MCGVTDGCSHWRFSRANSRCHAVLGLYIAVGGKGVSLLGDNSFRYDHHHPRDDVDDDDDDDDYTNEGRMEALSLLLTGGGGVRGVGHDNDNNTLDFFADSAATAANAAGTTHLLDNNETKARNSWMDIDIKELDKCLRHIPLHVRLKVPRHVGTHLQERYGNNNHNRKKTLAELREESKCIVIVDDYDDNDDDGGCASSNSIDATADPNHDNSNNVKMDGANNDKVIADNIKDDDNDDDKDLEAWLDDVIA